MSLTGSTSTIPSYEPKGGILELEANFTHELKLENNPNIYYVYYDNSDLTGIMGKKLYYEYNGYHTVLNGYYSSKIDSNYLTFYQVSGGTVIDTIVWINSGDTTANSATTGAHSISNSNLDYTSGWFVTSYNQLDLYFNKGNDTIGLMSIWNTSDFYSSSYVVRGFIKDLNTHDSFYLYNSNTTIGSYTEAPETFYTEIYPFSYTLFKYYQAHTLTINFNEVCDLLGNNGVTFNVVDSNENASPTYYGVSFNSSVYVNGSLYATEYITLGENDTSYFISLPFINQGQVTNVTIDSFVSTNPYNKTTFSAGSFTNCTPVTPCSVYTNTEILVTSQGVLQYYDGYGTLHYLTVYPGYFIFTTGVTSSGVSYGTIKGSQNPSDIGYVAQFSIQNIGTCFSPTLLLSVLSSTNVTCWNGSDGSITFSALGGDGSSYQYSIDNTNWQSSATFTGLNGTTSYRGYVRNIDNTGIVAQTSGTTSLTTTAPNATFAITNVSCNGGSNGSINVSNGFGGNGTSYSASTDGSTYYALPRTFTGLSQGSYTVYIKNNLNCVATYTEIVSQPTALSISLGSIIAPSCYNTTNGSFTATGSGGTAPYTYSLNGGSYTSTNSWSSLGNATYTVVIKDSNNCTATGTTTFNTTAPNATISVTNATCYGGTGYIVVSGGTDGSGSNYSTSLTSGGTYNTLPYTFTGLSAGSKTIYIKDGSGCIQSYSQTITQPTQLTSSAIGNAPTCYNGSDGTITATASGGVSPYTYSLNGVTYQSSATFTGITIGTYTVTVKDANNCTATSSSVSLATAAPNATFTITNVSCNGGSDGKIQLTNPTSGNGSSFSGSTNGTTYYSLPYTFTGLTSTTYTVYIKDDLGCIASYVETVGQPANPVSVTLTNVTAPSCYNTNDGSFTATGSGGTAPYTYSLNNGTFSTTHSWSSLSNIGYTVTIKDAKGCTATASVTFAVTAPNATITPSNNNGYTIACNGGTGTLAVSNGTGGSGSGYTVSSDNITYYTLPHTFTVTAGTTTIYVQDGNGCVKSYPQTITQPTSLSVSNTSTAPTCFNGSNGTISSTGSGGVTPYIYSFNGGSYSSTHSWTGLTNGTYTVSIKDANGCTASATNVVFNTTAPNATISVTNVACNGGTGTIAVSGGTGGSGTGYSGSTDNITYYALPKTFTGLTANTYTIYIKDSLNCVQSYSKTITQPPVLTISASGTNPTCYDGGNGTVTATASGGSGTYTYYISSNGSSYVSPQSSGTFTNLANGTYSVLVVDGNSCTAFSSNVSLAQTAPNATITLSSHNGYNISCNGGSDGSITVANGTGGSGTGYSASLDDVTYYTLPKTFGTLAANSYTVYVKDGSGCKQSYSQTITQPPAQTCTISAYVLDNGAGDGQIAVVVAGGAGLKTLRLYQDTSLPYNDFSTDNLLQTATNVANNTTYYFTNVPCIGGDYWVQVTDANGCVVHSTTEISICGYVQTLAVFKTGNNLSCTPIAPFSRIYLNTFDYQNYVAAGNILGPGMVIYSSAGVVYANNTIYDSNATNVWNVSSGVITSIKQSC